VFIRTTENLLDRIILFLNSFIFLPTVFFFKEPFVRVGQIPFLRFVATDARNVVQGGRKRPDKYLLFVCVCLIFIPRHLIGQQCVATLTHNFFKLLFLASLKCVKLHLSCLKKKAIKSYQKIKEIRSPPGATTEISKMSSHIFPPKRRKNKSRQAEKRVYTTLTCHLS
jgi:hypothetical protein